MKLEEQLPLFGKVSAWIVSSICCLSIVCCGGGGSASSIDRVLATPMHTGVDVADVNNDGLPDIVSVSQTLDPERNHANVFLQQSGGTFASKVEYLLGTEPHFRSNFILLADIDLDNQPDIIISHKGRGNPAGTQISLLLHDPATANRFLSPKFYDVGQSPDGIAVGDVDFDGMPDIVVATRSGLYLLRQDSVNPGNLLASMRISSASADAVQIGDLNNDGLPDVAAAEGQGIHLYLNTPANVGSFQAGSLIGTNGSPNDLALQDLNGDSRLDIAVSNYRSTTDDQHGSIAVILQDQGIDGMFSAPNEYIVSQAFRLASISVSDLDGDQRPDIVAAIQSALGGNDKVVVLLQSTAGQGVFSRPVGYSHSGTNDPWRVTTASLGPDTLPDLVLANALDGVYAYHQDPAGTGTFTSARKIGD